MGMKKICLGFMLLLIIGGSYFYYKEYSIHAIEILGLEKSGSELVAVIHMPNENQLALAKEKLKLQYYEADLVDEELLIIPYHKKTLISFYNVSYEEDELMEKDKLAAYILEQSDEVLYAKVPVPCGIPSMKLVVECDGKRGEYMISYDGRGDRREIEYVYSEENK